MTSVCVIDLAHWPGHSGMMVEGVLTALRRRELPIGLVTTGATLQELGDVDVPVREVGRARKDQFLRRASQVEMARRFMRAYSLDSYLDLYFDVSGPGLAVRTLPSTGVHIAHSISTVSGSAGWRSSAKTRINRLAVLRASRRGSSFVVHTPEAREVYLSFGADATLVPLPVHVSRTAPSAQRSPIVLFVGSDRREKGFDLLVDALALLPDRPRLVVAGALSEGGDRRAQEVLGDGFRPEGRVSRGRLHALYGQASLTVVPYRDSYARRASASAVLVEALVSGCPTVITPVLERHVEAGDAVVVSPSAHPSDLSRAIARAMADSTELVARAESRAARLWREHSFDSYVATLLSLIQRS